MSRTPLAFRINIVNRPSSPIAEQGIAEAENPKIQFEYVV